MAFDKDKPAASTSLRSSNPEILANNSAIEDAIDREHEFSTGGTATDQGHHVKGSARAYFQDGAPATRVNGEAFNSEDLGSLWFDTNATPDNEFFVLTATTPTWTPVSTEIIATLLAANRIFAGTLGVTGDFDVNTDKFTVAAATGNALVAGTFESTGIATLADASVTKTTAAPGADAQISNKKYVDDQITANIPTSGFWVASGSTVMATSMTSSNTFQDLDLSSVVGANDALVFLEVKSSAGDLFFMKPKGLGGAQSVHTMDGAGATGMCDFSGSNHFTYFAMATDSSGVIQVAASTSSTTFTIKVVGYIK